MLAGVLILLLFQLAGEVLVRLLGVPIPGSVIGLSLLFAVLLVRRSVPTPWQATAKGLLGILSLLFVPAGAGIIANLDLIRGTWLALTITLIGSTLITMTVTALVLSTLLRRFAAARQRGGQ